MTRYLKLLLFSFTLLWATLSHAQLTTITSFAPASGAAGTSVTIIGTNFNASASNNTVYFGAEKATVTTATPTQLTAVVPIGANFQPLTVTANGLTAYSAVPFMLTFNGTPLSANSFRSKIDLPYGENVYGIAAQDLDGDGKPDIVSVNEQAQYVNFYRNESQPVGEVVFVILCRHRYLEIPGGLPYG